MSTNIGSENLVDGGAASGGDDGACDDGDGDGDGVAGAASALLSSASSVSWQPSPVPVDWGRRGHRRVVVRPGTCGPLHRTSPHGARCSSCAAAEVTYVARAAGSEVPVACLV